MGHDVVTAMDGLEAIFRAKRQRFDPVLTDIWMPHEEGLGLIIALRKSSPNLRIIALSGKDPETLQDARLLGAAATLRKPVAAKTLLQCVAEVHASSAS